MNFDQYLDAKGLSCPLPLLKMKQALNKMPSSQVLKVEATDSGSLRDFRVFCDQSGHQLQQEEGENGEFIFFITKS